MRLIAVLSALICVHSATAAIVVQSVNITGRADARMDYQLGYGVTGTYSESDNFTLNTPPPIFSYKSASADGSRVPSDIWNQLSTYSFLSSASSSGQLDVRHGIYTNITVSDNVNIGPGMVGPSGDAHANMTITFNVTNSSALISFAFKNRNSINSEPYELVDLSSGSTIIDGSDSIGFSNVVISPGSYRFTSSLDSNFVEYSTGGFTHGEATLTVVPEASSLVLAAFPVLGLLLWKRRSGE